MGATKGLYKDSLICVAAVVLTAYIFQLITGGFNFDVFRFPVNILLGGALIVSVAGLSFFRDSRVFRLCSSVPFTVTLLFALLGYTLIMGLFPQAHEGVMQQRDVFNWTGITRVASSCPFVFLYITLLFSLGTVISKRLTYFRRRDYPFYLNHTGLFILLFAAGFGTPDRASYTMQVNEGDESSIGNLDGIHPVQLPLSVRLNEFIIEEYPPKLMLVDLNTGKFQPEKKPVSMEVVNKGATGKLLKWNINVEDYIPQAILTQEGEFRSVNMPGATEAARITALNPATGETKAGWIYRGNPAIPVRTLNLDEKNWVVLSKPDVRKYRSNVDVYMQSGEHVNYSVEVNKPLKIGKWTIYQYGYDQQMGKFSSYSIFQLVYDPWLNLAYLGIFLLAAGSFSMLWSGNKKNKRDGME